MKSSVLYSAFIFLSASLGMCASIDKRYSKDTCPSSAKGLNNIYKFTGMNLNSNAINIGDCGPIADFLKRGDIKNKIATLPGWNTKDEPIDGIPTQASPVAWKQKNFNCQFWAVNTLGSPVTIKASTMGYYLEQLIGCLNNDHSNVIYSTQKEDNSYIYFMVSPADTHVDTGPMLAAYSGLFPDQYREEPQNKNGQNSPLS
ncbi:hypothetical protein VTK73DRAFT_6304 [Phialemonium thermophilum]|uniref:Uncharacterized protein n=1 Tax=Phialemonium thermophilum TaxID=223376 RepID=A0ABR3WKB6_9PEZI